VDRVLSGTRDLAATATVERRRTGVHPAHHDLYYCCTVAPYTYSATELSTNPPQRCDAPSPTAVYA
jgi:hypothetical protein